jgi:hypothetical protein
MTCKIHPISTRGGIIEVDDFCSQNSAPRRPLQNVVKPDKSLFYRGLLGKTRRPPKSEMKMHREIHDATKKFIVHGLHFRAISCSQLTPCLPQYLPCWPVFRLLCRGSISGHFQAAKVPLGTEKRTEILHFGQIQPAAEDLPRPPRREGQKWSPCRLYRGFEAIRENIYRPAQAFFELSCLEMKLCLFHEMVNDTTELRGILHIWVHPVSFGGFQFGHFVRHPLGGLIQGSSHPTPPSSWRIAIR